MTDHTPTPATDDSDDHAGLDRRRLLKIGGMSAAALSLGAAGASVDEPPVEATTRPRRLRFNRDGAFKIVQFNDTQDDENLDRRTTELMEKVLDAEEPDLVVHNGDNITGGCDTPREMRQAMNNIVLPMEDRGIPWAITFGNHDEDSTPSSGLDEADMLRFYRSYRYNVNPPNLRGLTGTGNSNLLIAGSAGNQPAFNLWFLDSGRYAPKTIAGQDFEGYPTWDWIRMDQVAWYDARSRELSGQHGGPIPALMFMHIPLWEYKFMWYASVDSRTDADHARAVAKHAIVGEKNENESTGPFNSGMFSAILHSGDVKGVFCGHDHVNTYVGDYYGVLLGYAGNTGFGTYGLEGAERNRLRGARVYNLDENSTDVLVETHMVFAADYGIDLTPDDQSVPPAPLRR